MNKITIDMSLLTDEQMSNIIDIFASQHPKSFAEFTTKNHTFNLSCTRENVIPLHYYIEDKDEHSVLISLMNPMKDNKTLMLDFVAHKQKDYETIILSRLNSDFTYDLVLIEKKELNIEVTDIEWDTDEEDVDLPSSMSIKIDASISADMYNETISDKITEETGFCHHGFSYQLK